MTSVYSIPDILQKNKIDLVKIKFSDKFNDNEVCNRQSSKAFNNNQLSIGIFDDKGLYITEFSDKFDDKGISIDDFCSFGFGCLWAGERSPSHDENCIYFVFPPQKGFQDKHIKITGLFIENINRDNNNNVKYKVELEYQTKTTIFYTNICKNIDWYQLILCPILDKINNTRPMSLIFYKNHSLVETRILNHK